MKNASALNFDYLNLLSDFIALQPILTVHPIVRFGFNITLIKRLFYSVGNLTNLIFG